MAQPRALRRRARFAILALLVFIIWTTKPKRALRLCRDRADRVAHLDPELKREWDDDARADPLHPRCERVESSADLVRAGGLPVLELQKRAVVAGPPEGGESEVRGETRRRCLDVAPGDGGSHHATSSQRCSPPVAPRTTFA